MKNLILCCVAVFAIVGCSDKKNEATSGIDLTNNTESLTQKSSTMKKTLHNNLPTVGILIFEGFLTNEVVAPLDVFSKSNIEGNSLFNVVLIAKENKSYTSEEGLRVLPDFTIDQTPKLNVLVIPSSFNPENQTNDKELVNFVKEQDKTTDYIASHCAGAFLVGKSGIADNMEIVTYVTGGESLKKEYPNLKVMDDSKLSVVEDGKIISSNGNLVSYLASLDLLEKMTNKSHRKYVEEQLLLHRLVGGK